MKEVTVRYESAFSQRSHTPLPSFGGPSLGSLTVPFETGLRHLKVALCDGSQKSLTHLAKERIIHRADASKNTYRPLDLSQRVRHGVIGFLETAGYATLILPFVLFTLDKITHQPWYPKGGLEFRTHMEEGGLFNAHSRRKNPFDADGAKDPFYKGASWVRA